jgi:CRP-like cAMP-binding protein
MDILLDNSDESCEFIKDSVIFKEGDIPEAFYIIKSGSVRCLKWNDKRLSPVFTATEGDIVGEDCVLSDSNKYFYSAVALSNCSLIRVEKNDVFKYLNSQSPWVRMILDNLSEKIQHTTEVIAEHGIKDDALLKNLDFSQEEEVLFKGKL